MQKQLSVLPKINKNGFEHIGKIEMQLFSWKISERSALSVETLTIFMSLYPGGRQPHNRYQVSMYH